MVSHEARRAYKHTGLESASAFFTFIVIEHEAQEWNKVGRCPTQVILLKG